MVAITISSEGLSAFWACMVTWDEHGWGFIAARGIAGLTVSSPIPGSPPNFEITSHAPSLAFWPDQVHSRVANNGFQFQSWVLPIWLGLVPGLGLWALGTWAFRKHPAHACQRCGFDRRGLPSGQTPCPECGHVVT